MRPPLDRHPVGIRRALNVENERKNNFNLITKDFNRELVFIIILGSFSCGIPPLRLTALGR